MTDESSRCVLWTPAARRRLLPRRGDLDVAPLALEPEDVLARKLQKLFPPWLKRLHGSDARHEQLAKEIVRRYGRADVPRDDALDADVEGAALRVCTWLTGPHLEQAVETAVRFWIVTAGAPFAIRALARSARFDTLYDAKDPLSPSDDESPEYFAGGSHGWLLLRHHLAHLDEPAYRACCKAAGAERRRLRGRDRLHLRCVVACAFPAEQAWHVEDAHLARAQRGLLNDDVWLVLSSLADRDSVLALIADGFPHHYSYELLRTLGPCAFEPLRRMADSPLRRADARRIFGRAIALIVAPEVATWMADKLDDPQLGKIAESYLSRHPAVAIPALQRGRPKAGLRKTRAARLLDTIESRHEAERSGRPKRAKPPRARIGELPEAFDVPELARVALPRYWEASRLSRPVHRGSGKPFSPRALDTVGCLLVSSKLEAPPPLIDELKRIATAESLAELARSLLSLWESSQPPARDDAPLVALVAFGGDDTVERLANATHQWQLQRRRRWSSAGFEALRQLGTPEALSHLERMSREAKDETLRERAAVAFESGAMALGLSRNEILDQVVPSHGLGPWFAASTSQTHDPRNRIQDTGRSLLLEYDDRRIRVGVTPELQAFIHDEAGAPCRRLPRPSTKDSPAYSEAQESWKHLRKGIERTCRGESWRLERAMCSQGTWKLSRLALSLAHPLLGAMVRRLVWSTIDEKPLRFRLAEDGSLADQRDEPVAIPQNVEVRIEHPLLMSPEELRAWQQIFADYELIQPFDQLARRVWTPSAREARDSELHSVEGQPYTLSRLYALCHRGWRFNDGDPIRYLELPDGSPATVFLRCLGNLGAATLHEGKDPHGSAARIPFGRLDPITFSEIVHDLHTAIAK